MGSGSIFAWQPKPLQMQGFTATGD